MKGTWIGLEYDIEDPGVVISGDVPSKSDATFGVTRGQFEVIATSAEDRKDIKFVNWAIQDQV